MRHQVFGRKLSRDTQARAALARNLASVLFEQGKITTTLARAKFAKPYAENLITIYKKKKLAQVRQLHSLLSNKAFEKLTRQIGPGFDQRNGGYTRIVKLGQRAGDAAPMARLQLLEFAKKKEKT